MDSNLIGLMLMFGIGLAFTGILNVAIFKFPILRGHSGSIVMAIMGAAMVAFALYNGGSI